MTPLTDSTHSNPATVGVDALTFVATHIMAGLCANPDSSGGTADMAQWAVHAAKVLIAEVGKWET